jgi:TonB-linked SusC/RagA family outer membrane protein
MYEKNTHLRKIFIAMKLMPLFLFLAISPTTALETYSQSTRLSINLKSTTVKDVLEKIEEKSEFFFLYNSKLIDVNRVVSISGKEKKISEILNDLFQGTDVVSTVVEKQIVLTNKSVQADFLQVIRHQRQRSVSGRVTDSSGAGLPGVSVVVKGTPIGTSTDVNGYYSLSDIPESAILQFSFVGMETKEILIGNKDRVDVMLIKVPLKIDDILVIGYGTQKKIDYAGAIATIKNDQFRNIPALSVDNILQGKAAGMLVTATTGEPGTSASIRIRGNNSITAGSEPLYVIDGNVGGASINSINPNDIASITVLKDASATAIYGSRGGNGVILITTKRGTEGKARVNINLQRGQQWLPRKIDMLNATEYAEMLNESQSLRNLPPIFDDPKSLGEGTDWQEEITRTAPVTDLNISVNKGNEDIKFYISANYFNQKGIIINSGVRRYQFRANFDTKLNDRIKVGSSINLSNINFDNNTIRLAERDGALMAAPTMPVYNPDGSFYSKHPHPNLPAPFNNPVALGTLNSNITNNNSLIGNVFLEYAPFSWMTFKSNFGLNVNMSKNNNYISGQLPNQIFTQRGGEATITNSDNTSWQSENMININKQINDDHLIESIIGLTYQAGNSNTVSAGAFKFLSDLSTVYNLGAGDPATRSIASGRTEWGLVSYLARVSYKYKERYLATVTGRYDGSSRLSKGNQYAFFPSLALGWILSNENFIKDLNAFSFLKLRASYGISGNQAVAIYQTYPRLSLAGNFVQNNVAVTAYRPSTIANPNLKWETKDQFDIGLEVGFFNNRLRFDIDYYDATTNNLLLDAETPTQSGYATFVDNNGKISNKGFEIGITSINTESTDFVWSTNLTVASNTNKVIKLAGKGDIITNSFWNVNPVGLLREGEAIGSFYGAIYEGTWKSAEEISNVGTMQTATPGSQRYKDLNEDGTFNIKDYIILGNGDPKFYGGLGNTLRYKGFELNVFFYGSYGNKIYNINAGYYRSSDAQYNQYKEAVNRWTPSNPTSDIPTTNIANRELVPSTRWIYDGSFLRLQTLSLSYNVPLNYGIKKYLQNMAVTITGTNLWLLSGYKHGYDPEVNTSGQNSVLRGFDIGAYPKNRSFMIGLNVTL